MLRKLIKHDLKQEFIPLLIFGAGFLAMCALLPEIVKPLPEYVEEMIKMLFITFAAYGIIIAFVLVPCSRFGKPYVKQDSAYLFNTLPVKPKDLMITKLVTGYLSTILAVIVFILGDALLERSADIFRGIIDMMKQVPAAFFTSWYGTMEFICIVLLAVLFPACFFATSVLTDIIAMRYNWSKIPTVLCVIFNLTVIFMTIYLVAINFLNPDSSHYGSEHMIGTGLLILTLFEIAGTVIYWILGERIMRKHINLQ
ncbi:MAG: hypothetical protein LBM87_03900 [Ruminococcus sp.]|jgi:hypothetical protein|nr:hypothetical protein [Ruminococcus sp.]